MAIQTIQPEQTLEPEARYNRAVVLGPPGTGKTTHVSRQISRAANRFGPEGVLVASFTRAAAAELMGRDLRLAKGKVGTLHSHCYQAIGCPQIAETKIREWNKLEPRNRLTVEQDDLEEADPEFPVKTVGDDLYCQMQILRARMTPVARWPTPVQRFAAAWTRWKNDFDYYDFTDLIEIGVRDFKFAPGDPNVIVIDEAQDLTPLQFNLVTQWGDHADYLWLAGDDDQTLYTFAGADPKMLVERTGQEYYRNVLSQSYRLPRKVRALGELWVQKVSIRENKLYMPRSEDGVVRCFHNATWKAVGPLVDDAERRIARGQTVMFLATCSYFLEPLKRVLRQRGLPFHNPYRRKRLDWNPLQPDAHGKAVPDRLLAFLKPRDDFGSRPWTAQDLTLWTRWLRPAALMPDAADMIAKLPPDTIITLELLETLFQPTVLGSLLSALDNASVSECAGWYIRHAAPRKRRLIAYPARVMSQLGVEELSRRPKIIVGTGHSVKGGEADVVYIFPDLSAAGIRQWNGRREERDAVIRLGYVMMTRAREELVICAPAGRAHMPIAAAAVEAARS